MSYDYIMGEEIKEPKKKRGRKGKRQKLQSKIRKTSKEYIDLCWGDSTVVIRCQKPYKALLWLLNLPESARNKLRKQLLEENTKRTATTS